MARRSNTNTVQAQNEVEGTNIPMDAVIGTADVGGPEVNEGDKVEHMNVTLESGEEVNLTVITPASTEEPQPQIMVEAKPNISPILVKYDLDVLKSQYKTKSALIRFLAGDGFKTGEIAKVLGIRYQHVRNVMMQELKTDRAEQPNPELALRARVVAGEEG
jgi:hypothetical protein